MKMLSLVLVAGALMGVPAMLNAQPSRSASPSRATKRTPMQQTEIVFIGANHAYGFLRPGFLPADIRALLTKIGPSVLCVENDADWPEQEGIPTYPHEQYAGLTWARAYHVPVVHTNWDSENFRRSRRETIRTSALSAFNGTAPGFASFQDGYIARMQFSAGLAFGETGSDLANFHRTELPRTLTEIPDDPESNVRNDSIAERVRDVIAKHRGTRIALLYGAGHYYALKRRLEADPRVRVVLPTRYFPLTTSEVTKGWLDDDALVLLGVNLDDWRVLAFPQARNHELTKRLLDRLAANPRERVASIYYRARWRMLFGDVDSAKVLLQQVIASQGRTVVPYRADPRWSWPPFRTFEQKAHFQLAALDDGAGRRESALSQYRALLALADSDLVVPMGKWQRLDMRPFLRSFLDAPYEGGMREAYRAELAMARAR